MSAVTVPIERLERIVALLEKVTEGIVGRDISVQTLRAHSLATGMLEAIAHPFVHEESLEDVKQAYALLYAENSKNVRRIEELESSLAVMRAEIAGVPV